MRSWTVVSLKSGARVLRLPFRVQGSVHISCPMPLVGMALKGGGCGAPWARRPPQPFRNEKNACFGSKQFAPIAPVNPRSPEVRGKTRGSPRDGFSVPRPMAPILLFRCVAQSDADPGARYFVLNGHGALILFSLGRGSAPALWIVWIWAACIGRTRNRLKSIVRLLLRASDIGPEMLLQLQPKRQKLERSSSDGHGFADQIQLLESVHQHY